MVAFFQKIQDERMGEMTKKRFHIVFAFFVCFSLFFVSCQKADEKITEDTGLKRQIFAMDTIMELTVYGENAEKAMTAAAKVINRLDLLFSVTNSRSDVYKINSANGKPVKVEKETYELIKTSISYSEQTDGAFDISVYPLVKAWGFTTDDNHVPTEGEREQAREKIDYKKIRCLANNQIQLQKGMEIDLGALAKGYASQKVMECWQKIGVSSAIISLGGNVQTIGKKEDGSQYQVGITDPDDGTSLFGALPVENKAVVTSGIYQRNFTENGVLYHHIMDSKTGMPAANNLASVTVIADNGIEADALATALFVMGEEKIKKYQKNHPDIQVIAIRKDGTFWQSDDVQQLVVN